MTQLHDLLLYSRTLYPDKTAVICANKHYSYSQIDKDSTALANCLINNGVVRGDRVVVQLGNTIESIISFWGILKANAIASIIAADLSAEKINYILKDSAAKCFITDVLCDDYFDKTLTPNLDKIILGNSLTQITDRSVITFSSAIDRFDCITPPTCLNLDIDLAAIIYTSGSTGEPKGVMLTHRNMLTGVQAINAYLHNHSNDIILSALPLSFDYGLYQMLLAFFVGATLVLEKDLLWPTQLLRAVVKEHATALPGVPTLFSLLYDHYKRTNFNLNSIRYVTNTGAALSEKQIFMIQQMFPLAQIFSMYGLTECKRCSYLPPKDISRKPKSVGIAIPNTELWIVDENDQKLAANRVGQLVIRGSTVMKGYWNKPDQTTLKLKEGPLTGEMVLYTGDYCYLDEEGYLYYQGRMDEIIKSAGIKISPKEIEDAISLFPGIREVAAIGVENEHLGMAVHAYVTTDDKNITVQQLSDHCKRKLESKKRPKEIFLLSAIPKTFNGKIDKQSLLLSIRGKSE